MTTTLRAGRHLATTEPDISNRHLLEQFDRDGYVVLTGACPRTRSPT